MKNFTRNFMIRVIAAALVVWVAIVLTSTSNAQQTNIQAPASTASPQPATPPSTQGAQNPSVAPPEPAVNAIPRHGNEPTMPTAETQTPQREYSGRIVRENGKIVLQNAVTKDVYEIDDASKVKRFMGKAVKVTGKRDPHSNLIHVETIKAQP